jgi:hypothetical protein
MDFDGANQYVDIFNSEIVPAAFQTIGNNNDYTIVAWIKTSAGTGNTGTAWASEITIFELRQERATFCHYSVFFRG